MTVILCVYASAVLIANPCVTQSFADFDAEADPLRRVAGGGLPDCDGPDWR